MDALASLSNLGTRQVSAVLEPRSTGAVPPTIFARGLPRAKP
jgi:hypothetical protein